MHYSLYIYMWLLRQIKIANRHFMCSHIQRFRRTYRVDFGSVLPLQNTSRSTATRLDTAQWTDAVFVRIYPSSFYIKTGYNDDTENKDDKDTPDNNKKPVT